MRRGQEVRDHQRGGGDIHGRRVGERAAHPIRQRVPLDVGDRRGDGVGVAVHRIDVGNAEPRGRDGEDARARAEIERARRPGALEEGLEEEQAAGGAAVLARAEGPAGLDREHQATVGRGRLPGRRDDETAAHGERREVGAPRVGPVVLREGGDA